MAEAPGHRLGQIIGSTLEKAVEPVFSEFAAEHDLYLDTQGERAARTGKKVTWEDSLSNKHDLDFVFERGGSDERIGVPVAFIETAWRRYTKHSRNKAQEIQGAVLPLLVTYSHAKPFAGVVLAGVFTKGSLDQLRSNDFAVLYAPYETIIDVFGQFKIDVAYDEDTPDQYLYEQIEAYDALGSEGQAELGAALREALADPFKEFMDELSTSVLRQIASVSLIPLHGATAEFESVEAAIEGLRSYKPPHEVPDLVRFELIIRYDNGDRVTADFQQAGDAIAFLETFLPG